jgi:hypothetical protein
MSDYKRLTVEECAALSERHGFKFVFGSYGLHEDPDAPYHNCGCAVSMAVLRHTDDMTKARSIIQYSDPSDENEEIRRGLHGYSDATGLPKNYLAGLVLGYEAHDTHAKYNSDLSKGVEDGIAIRKYAISTKEEASV